MISSVKLMFIVSHICLCYGSPRKSLIDSEELEHRKAMENPNLYEGDILLSPKTRFAIRGNDYLWPNKIVLYEYDNNIEGATLSKILEAMKHISSKTCIKFKRRTNEKDYIRLIRGDGCYSYVGRNKGMQLVSIGKGCESFGTIVHELMHAIGFFHHHARSDRDEYLNIHWSNIARQFHNQFYRLNPKETQLFTSFDYDSIMMYGPRSFSIDGYSSTISPKKPGVTIKYSWQKYGLSEHDAYSINKLYGCV